MPKTIKIPYPKARAAQQSTKIRLAAHIKYLIKDRGLRYGEAAQLMKTTRPRVNNACNGKFDKISLEALFQFLVNFGYDVTVVVTPKSARMVKPTVRSTQKSKSS